MSEAGEFTINLEHLQDYEFKVRFDLEGVDELRLDEPSPLGAQRGPNASRLLAAAAANCLSASLLYCLSKNDVPTGAAQTTATCRLVRNEAGRLRIGSMTVQIKIGEEIVNSPRFSRCSDLFEDFCVVTASIREGIPVAVELVDSDGTLLHRGD